MKTSTLAFVVLVCCNSQVIAQPIFPLAKPTPTARPTPSVGLSLSQIVPAKIDVNGDRKQIVLMIEGFRIVKPNIVINGAKPEMQTLKVPGPNGEVVDQELLLGERTVEHGIKVPAGIKPKILPLEMFRFFDLDAQPVLLEDAVKALSKLRPIFLLDQFPGEPKPVEANIKQLFKSDVLIVVAKSAVRELPDRPIVNLTIPPRDLRNAIGDREPRMRLSLTQLVAAKIDRRDDLRQIILMVESYRTETRMVKITRPVPQNRSRQVTLPNGQTVEEIYTESVMEQQTIDQAFRVPAGPQPQALPLENLRFFNLDAQPITYEEAATILNTLQPVFLLERLSGELEPVDATIKQAFRSEVLIVVTDHIVRDPVQRANIIGDSYITPPSRLRNVNP